MSIGYSDFAPPGVASLQFGEEAVQPERSAVPFLPPDCYSFAFFLPSIRAALALDDKPASVVGGPLQSGISLLETLSVNIVALQDYFADRLYDALRGRGIDVSCKLTLRLDDSANLTVAGEHPEKARIMELLAGNPDYAFLFTQIATQSSALRDLRNLYALASFERPEDGYATLAAGPGECVYQLSLKGEMNHYYFTR